ncbi:MAG: ABC transporter substrate-binding protein [Actinomycetota bacterium]
MLVVRRRLSVLVFPVLVLVACGTKTTPAAGASSTSSASPSPDAFPVTVGSVTLAARPVRIVSLSPTATETLFAIGAGPQVVAVDDQSNYPSNAPTTKLSGFEPNVEAIAGYEPDLVVISIDPGGLVKSLKSLSIPTLLQPAAASLRDTYDQIDQLGRATGHRTEAAALVAQMRSRIAAILASVPAPVQPIRVYHELDDTYYSATSETFVGRVYRAFGLDNIADGVPAKAGDYPQLSSEYIVGANPQLIVLADASCCGQTAATLRARPGWSSVAALHVGGVVEADGDVVSRWGPRVVDFYRLVARAVIAVERSEAA